MNILPRHVLRLLRERLHFLETDRGFIVAAQSADHLICHLTYRKGSTEIVVAWDFREGMVSVDFYPLDDRRREPRLEGRVILAQLVAVNGGTPAELVVEPEEVTEGAVIATVDALGQLLRRYAADLLEDRWDSAVRLILEWNEADRWTEWRHS